MLLKIGELSKRAGTTVRALHHYEAVGLLRPSARSVSGYRLYEAADMVKLVRIQSLQKLGLSLAEIGDYLSVSERPVQELIAQQIHLLNNQIDDASRIRDRLLGMQNQLLVLEPPSPAEQIGGSELLEIFKKYFSGEQLTRLPFYLDTQGVQQEGADLVKAIRGIMELGVEAKHPSAQHLAQKWMELIAKDTKADASMLVQLSAMHEMESKVQFLNGVTTDLLNFVSNAFEEYKLEIYKKYLSENEFLFLNLNLHRRSAEWLPLILELKSAMDAGCTEDSDSVRGLVSRWFELFCSFAGKDPETHKKIRNAFFLEPDLEPFKLINREMNSFINSALISIKSSS